MGGGSFNLTSPPGGAGGAGAGGAGGVSASPASPMAPSPHAAPAASPHPPPTSPFTAWPASPSLPRPSPGHHPSPRHHIDHKGVYITHIVFDSQGVIKPPLEVLFIICENPSLFLTAHFIRGRLSLLFFAKCVCFGTFLAYDSHPSYPHSSTTHTHNIYQQLIIYAKKSMKLE